MGYFDDLIPAPTQGMVLPPQPKRGFFNDLIPEKAPEPEPVGAVQGFFGALKRGVKQIGDLPDTIDLTNKAGVPDNSYRAHRIGQLEGISGQEVIYNNQRAAADRVVQNQLEQDAVPRSAAQQRLDKADGWKAKFSAWLRDPVELTASIAAESLPASIAGSAIGGAVGGPPGMIAGVGLSSGLMTFSSELLGNAAARGVNLRDPAAMTAWIRSKDYDEDATRALTKSVVIGAIDSATAAQAGRFIVPALKTGLAKNVALATAKEVGMQASAGAGGEALGSKAAGQEIDPFNVFAEAIAEVAGAPSEVAGNFRARSKGLRARYDSKAADAARVVQPIERPATSTARDAETGQPMNVTAPQAIEPEISRGGEQVEKEVRKEEVLTPAGTPVQPAAPAPAWAMDALKETGWNPKWPFVPADLSNPSFVAAIKSDPGIPDAEKAKILSFAPGGEKEFKLSQTPPPTGTPVVSSGPTIPVPAVAGAVAADAAEAPVVEEPKIGVSRPAKIDPNLATLSDEQFNAAFTEADKRVIEAEKRYDKAGGKLTTQERSQLGEIQDRYESFGLERFRRTNRDATPEVLTERLIEQAEGAAKFGPDSPQFHRAKILLDELQRQGVTEEQAIKSVSLRSPDAAEIFKGRMQDLRKVVSQMPQNAVPESRQLAEAKVAGVTDATAVSNQSREASAGDTALPVRQAEQSAGRNERKSPPTVQTDEGARETGVSTPPKKRGKKTLRDTYQSPTVKESLPVAEKPKLTPMMEQYQRIKSQLPSDALLAFRLGDFYEFFFDDAKTAAKVLKITETKRGDVSMSGIPYHAADSYFSKLLQAGHKVAVVDSTDDPSHGKPAERKVTKILSPETKPNTPAVAEQKISTESEIPKSTGHVAFVESAPGLGGRTEVTEYYVKGRTLHWTNAQRPIRSNGVRKSSYTADLQGGKIKGTGESIQEFIARKKKQSDAFIEASSAQIREFGRQAEERAEQQRKQWETKPATAEAKMQTQVTEVAKTEGTRPAKEIKSELVQRLEDEMAKLAEESEAKVEDRGEFNEKGKKYREFLASASDGNAIFAQVETLPNGKVSVKFMPIGGKQFTRNFESQDQALAIAKGMVGRGTGKVTIDIPGDGKFTIDRDGIKIAEVWKRALALSTASKAGNSVSATTGRAGDLQEQAHFAIKTYGSAEDAYRAVKRQAEQMAEDAPDVGPLLTEIRERTKAYKLDQEADKAAVLARGEQSGIENAEKEIAKIEKLKRQTTHHKAKLEKLQEDVKRGKKDKAKYEKEQAAFENQAIAENAKLEGTQSSVASGEGTNNEKSEPLQSGSKEDSGETPEVGAQQGGTPRAKGVAVDTAESMAKDLEGRRDVLRGGTAELTALFSDANSTDLQADAQTKPGHHGDTQGGRGDLHPGTAKGTAGVPVKTRIFITRPTEGEASAVGVFTGTDFVAHRILFGVDPSETQSFRADFGKSLFAKLPGIRLIFIPLGTQPNAEVAYHRSDINAIVVNQDRVNAADFSNPSVVAYWDAVLSEELIHAASSRLSSREEIIDVWKSLTPDEQSKLREVYDRETRGAEMTEYQLGSEYVRLVIQQRLTGTSPENFSKQWRITTILKKRLTELLNFLKDIFGAKPENDVARQVIERIEGAIKGEAPIPGSVFGATGETLHANAKPIADILQTGDREDAGDDYIPTEVFGIKDNILDKSRYTDAERAKARGIAQEAFKEAGLAVTRGTEDGEHFQLTDTGAKDNPAGRRLAEILKREIGKYGQGALEITELVQSIVLDFKTGRMDAMFDKPVRNALYALAQGERSFRGVSLNALRGAGEDIRFVAQNIDVHLQRVWHEAFGGEHIDSALEKIREKFKAFFTPEVVKAVAGAVGGPVTPEIVKAGLDTNFSNLNELRDTYTDLLTKAGVEPKSAVVWAKRIVEALRPTIRAAGTDATSKVEPGLTMEERILLKGKKPLWLKIVEAVQRGEFDNAPALREKARESGWKPPTDEQIARLKRLAERERSLANLTQKELAAAGGDPAKIRLEKIVREQATLPSRVPLMRQMEAEWANIIKPVNLLRMFGKHRANNAAFINELISANLLLRLSFAPKQALSVMSQFAFHIPTRAISQAIALHAQSKALEQPLALRTDIYNALAGALKSARAGFKDSIAQFVAALKGRGEARNIDRLMSGISALERIEAKAKQYKEEGKTAQAIMMQMLSFIKMGYRIAQAFDNLHGVPSEFIEMRHQAVMGLMKNGVERAAANAQADNIIESVKASHIQAVAQAKAILDEMGEEASPEKIREISYRIARGWAYENIRNLGLPADDFQAANKQLREVIGWNEKEVGMGLGVGGFVGAGVRGAGKVAENLGVPLAIGRFSNAIAIGINRALHFTPLGMFPGAFGGDNNAWFKTEMDRNQRKVEASIGTLVGSLAVALALSGAIIVRLKWPRDPEERDLFEAQGHRPNTLEIPHDDGTFTAISLNTGMAQFLAPYLAAGGALRDLFDEREKKQAKLNADAAKKGLPPEKIRPLSTADIMGVAASAGYQTILGGRTSGGAVASMLDYGVPNVTKIVAGQVAPIVPLLPAMQEISRMGGVVLDSKLATFTDFLLPLPSSPARRVNFLGDPSGTPDDLQRIVQILTGGSYPNVDPSQAKKMNAYKVLFASGYRPPSVNPNKGFAIGNSFRPFTDAELERYAVTRGQEFKAALGDLPEDSDLKTVRAAYRSANQTALGKMGVAGARPKKSSKSKIGGLRSRFKSPRSTFRKRRNSLRFSYAR